MKCKKKNENKYYAKWTVLFNIEAEKTKDKEKENYIFIFSLKPEEISMKFYEIRLILK